MMRKEAVFFISVITIGVLMFFPLSREVTPETAPWKIGMLVCLTGPCSADGTDALRGAKFAVDELNARGGVLGHRIELVIQDTNEAVSGTKAVTGYRQLRLDSSIKYFIGPSWTPAGLALAPIVALDSDILMASPSLGAPEFHMAGGNIFNVRGTDEVASRKEAQYAYQQGIRTVAILSSEQPWEAQQAKFFEDEFIRLGGTIVIKEEPLPTVTDVKAEVLRIYRAKPEAVFFASIILMPQAAQELRDLKYGGIQIASNIDGTRIEESNGALEGAVFFSFQKPESDFQQKFYNRYQEAAQPAAAVGYDTVLAYAKAAERAGTLDVSKTKHLMMTLDFNGASGRIHFDTDGCAKREPRGWKVAGLNYGALDAG